MSIKELLVISVEVTRKMSKFSQVIGTDFSVNCVVFPYFPTSPSPYHPKSLTSSSLKPPYPMPLPIKMHRLIRTVLPPYLPILMRVTNLFVMGLIIF